MALTNYTKTQLAQYVQSTGAKNIEGESHGAGHDAHGGHGGGHADAGRQLHHMYVPMQQKGHMLENGKKVPVHNLHVHTRAQFLSGLIASGFRTGGLGTAYKSYFWAVVCFVLTVLSYGFNLYVAAVFAFMTGLFWSRRLIEPPWSITWFKGKALYYSK
ncbi:hypothetical protein HY994_05180 [Candidatus Micrarchaeota archaeon]|nr:hypothetical protein [Candidatus Micrarchaeota archaeon]